MSKLTVRKIETAKGPAKLGDPYGLYLRVSPRGAKMWIQRLTIRGRRTDNGIGHYPAMGLAEARAVALERWKIAKAGGDPRVPRGKPAGPTFRDAADVVIAMHETGWRNPMLAGALLPYLTKLRRQMLLDGASNTKAPWQYRLARYVRITATEAGPLGIASALAKLLRRDRAE